MSKTVRITTSVDLSDLPPDIAAVLLDDPRLDFREMTTIGDPPGKASWILVRADPREEKESDPDLHYEAGLRDGRMLNYFWLAKELDRPDCSSGHETALIYRARALRTFDRHGTTNVILKAEAVAAREHGEDASDGGSDG